jgi:formylglycine-generating enzyme
MSRLTKGASAFPDNDHLLNTKGENYLLVIGIDKYEVHPTLKNAVADATAFATVMTARYGFKHLVEPLYDENANQRNIRKALGKCESLQDDDRLIVFYSGHGWYKTASKLGYLVPSDAEEDPNSDFIAVNFVNDIFRAVKAKHILLVVDCCFGGSFGVERNISTAEMTAKVALDLDTKKSRMVLSSGGIEPVSDGLLAEKNSPFTKPLIEILQNNKANETVFSDFFTLLRKKTKWNAEQMPQYKVLQHLGHDDGELAFYCTDLESPEERAYNQATETPTITNLTRFIKDFPQSDKKAEIRAVLKETRAAEAWGKIKNSKHIEKFDEFIDEYPDSPFAELARQKMEALEIVEEIITPKIITPPTPAIIIPTKKLDFEPDLIFVEGGTFKMGSNDYDDEKPIHDVRLDSFYMGKYPITQAQWKTIMGNNPSHFKGDNLPVEQVSWEDTKLFLEKLNQKVPTNLQRGKYRLPTEAEWEYAARGGNKSQGYTYSGSNDIDEVAWYDKNSGNKAHEVGTKKANELGIYDMSGNVWEWCEDWYGTYENEAQTNPRGADRGSNRVSRGGGWLYNPQDCRATNRYDLSPTGRDNGLGFRVALSQ